MFFFSSLIMDFDLVQWPFVLGYGPTGLRLRLGRNTREDGVCLLFSGGLQQGEMGCASFLAVVCNKGSQSVPLV